MSGFGGGFGSAPPNTPFGSPLAPNPSPTRFGGFGAAPPPSGFGAGFGAAPASGFGLPPVEFGGGFGASGNSAFPFSGGPSSFGSSSSSGFGNVPATPGFGSSNSTTGFGVAPSAVSTPAFGVSTTPSFGGSTTPTPSFGASTTSAPSFGSSTAAAPAFGVSATSTPVFGVPTTSTPAFGASATSTPFGASTGTTRFGSAPSATRFGGSPAPSFQPPASGFAAPASVNSTANPFGGPTTASPAPSISFGVSSNVAAPTPSQSFSNTGFGSSTVTATGFGVSTTSPTGFGSSSYGSASTISGFAPSAVGSSGFGAGAQSDNEDMMDGGGGVAQYGTGPSFSVWPSSVRSLSPVPEPSGFEDSSMSPTPVNDEAKTSEEELKARIQEKKKKLAELKRRKEAAAAARVEPAPIAAVAASVKPNLNADAPAFVSGKSKSLADRNATRFAVKPSTITHLPEDLQNRENVASAYKEGGPEATQDIENAVSLVGTCPYMCPDDELLRRQREGDIQLLETPQPGTIHPQEWTLRETAVKRFRRSAADYKLDVPEWIRPPDVLEKVCGYLEEWVMERDRQGADSRYPESESPPPLDVYQFIWDRTRMVRKDFILQNYVGTGGECDARAVRCHERIARWHAMCEHQLCHIPDFVSAQSQQNIQELGQTMKTLNQYYDDSLGRSVVEISDEEGRETRTDLKGTSHGCSFDFVRGTNPTDFDGTPLKNDASSTHISKRLIGANAVNSASRGTAEPEMRGLYILLTMNNDGGMEVLKYASYLFQNRRDVYDSKPVQLAMQIYKAKKEVNYARFFSILRHPSTPYLFACIMFKYVEQMRKAAFRIMAKTYGAKRKDTEEAMYDAYPLKRLAILLCFEDMDEARAACKHYNITVKAEEVSSTSSPSKRARMEIIYWRMSEFKESKDPIKKVVLPLKPRKMIRTIESKLQGATRLAVCRGEVSGDGASLSIVHDRSNQSAENRADAKPVALSTDEIEARNVEEETARRLQEEQQQQMGELAAKRKMEDKRRMREEQKKKEEAKRKQDEVKHKKEQEAKRQALLLQKQKQHELRQRQADDERRRKLELEEVIRAAETAAREEQSRRKAEEQRRDAEREEARRRAEAAKRERLKQQELQRKREEGERKEKIRLEEEERRRQEKERLRLHQLKLQREREEQERRRREEEARRIAEAREAKINASIKLLIWRRLRRRLDRELQKERTRQSLCRIDPTLSNGRVLVNLSEDFPPAAEESDLDPYSDLLPGMHVLDLLSRRSNPPLELSAMLRKASFCSGRKSASLGGSNDVVLAKLAVVLPSFAGPKADSMQALLHIWLGRRLQYCNEVQDKFGSARSSHEVRTVVSTEFRDAADCDMVLLVVPPFFGDESLNVRSRVCFPRCDDNIPQALLCLDNGEYQSYAAFVNNLLSSLRNVPAVHVVDAMGTGVFDLALEECCDALLESFVEAGMEGRTRGSLVRLSLSQLGFSCIRGALWRAGVPFGAGEEITIMNCARGTLMALFLELNLLASSLSSDLWWNWPAHDFANKDGVVKDYFGEGIHLPLNWKENLSRSEIEPALNQLYSKVDGSLRDVVARLTDEAPERIREGVKDMLSKRQFRRCLEYALVWREVEHKPFVQETVVYLPEGNVRDVIEGCVRRMALEDDSDDDNLDLANVSGNVELEDQADEKENILWSPMDEPVLREEIDWVRGGELEPLAFDSSKSFGEALRTPESTVMTPSGVINTPMTPAGVSTPMTVPGSKRSLDSVARDKVLHSAKRRKDDHLTKNQRESMAFTQKLEALLNGETTFNVDVGKSTLSELLRDAPDIELPSSFRTN